MSISLLLPLTIYTFGTRNKFKTPHLCFLFFIVVVVVSKASLIPNRQVACHCVLSVVQEGQRDEAVLYCFLFGKYLFFQIDDSFHWNNSVVW